MSEAGGKELSIACTLPYNPGHICSVGHAISSQKLQKSNFLMLCLAQSCLFCGKSRSPVL